MKCKGACVCNAMFGADHHCEYKKAKGLACKDCCIVYYGDINPNSGKRINLVFRAINKAKKTLVVMSRKNYKSLKITIPMEETHYEYKIELKEYIEEEVEKDKTFIT